MSLEAIHRLPGVRAQMNRFIASFPGAYEWFDLLDPTQSRVVIPVTGPDTYKRVKAFAELERMRGSGSWSLQLQPWEDPKGRVVWVFWGLAEPKSLVESLIAEPFLENGSFWLTALGLAAAGLAGAESKRWQKPR